MKVEFLKNYRHTFKAFSKGDVCKLDPLFAEKLLKKGIVKRTDVITEEEKFIKTKKDK